MTSAYPLSWPSAWPRTHPQHRVTARFFTVRRLEYGVQQNRGVPIPEAIKRVLAELDRFDAVDAVISTNLMLRRDGLPLADQRAPADPGAAVYWTDEARRRNVMAIDIYNAVTDNLAAIAATLDAMRAIERHGGAQVLERAFTGFAAIAPPARWFSILGVPPDASPDEINAAFRSLAAKHHPDRGGSHARFAEISAARDQALKECTT
jgi:hypothetical protein